VCVPAASGAYSTCVQGDGGAAEGGKDSGGGG